MTLPTTLVAVLATVVSLVLTTPATAHPAHGWDVRCGESFDNGFGWFNLKGYNVSCSVARKAANRYVFGGDRSPKGWERCGEKQVGDEVWKVNCKRHKNGKHQHVRFKYGA